MLLFADVDNTLVCSHRHRIASPVVWVETLGGNEQGFISQRAYEFYRTQTCFQLVPVTTRTHQQYSRLEDAFAVFGWDDALICNGAILLRHGIEDDDWTRESLGLSLESRDAYFAALELMHRTFKHALVVSVEPFMFYVKDDNPDEVFSVLSKLIDHRVLLASRDARKVYCIPRALSKGRATQRYKSRFGFTECIAAGDGELDVSMLEQADVCLYPSGMSSFFAKGQKIPCAGFFPDRICDVLEGIQKG